MEWLTNYTQDFENELNEIIKEMNNNNHHLQQEDLLNNHHLQQEDGLLKNHHLQQEDGLIDDNILEQLDNVNNYNIFEQEDGLFNDNIKQEGGVIKDNTQQEDGLINDNNNDSDNDNIYEEEIWTNESTSILLMSIKRVTSVSSLSILNDDVDVDIDQQDVRVSEFEQLTPPLPSERIHLCDVRTPGGRKRPSSHREDDDQDVMVANNSLTSIIDISSVDYSRWTGRCCLSQEDGSFVNKELQRYFGLKQNNFYHQMIQDILLLNNENTHNKRLLYDAYIVHILEIILRADTPIKYIMTGVAKVASLLNLEYEEVPSYSNDSHYTEVDDDVVDQDDCCCCHVVLKKSITSLSHDKDDDWSYIDVQVRQIFTYSNILLFNEMSF